MSTIQPLDTNQILVIDLVSDEEKLECARDMNQGGAASGTPNARREEVVDEHDVVIVEDEVDANGDDDDVVQQMVEVDDGDTVEEEDADDDQDHGAVEAVVYDHVGGRRSDTDAEEDTTGQAMEQVEDGVIKEVLEYWGSSVVSEDVEIWLAGVVGVFFDGDDVRGKSLRGCATDIRELEGQRG